MNNEELDALNGLDCEERYDYCLSMVVEEKDVWILVNHDEQFLKIYSEDGDFEYLPVWPSAELAKHYSDGSQGLKPISISLPVFMKKWISGLERDGLDIGVFPGSDSTVWITTPSEFKKDLQDELSDF